MRKDEAIQKAIDILCDLEEVTPDDVRYAISAYEATKLEPKRRELHDAIKYGLNACPSCGSGDVRWCNISVRPYCNECGHWGMSHHGTAAEAIQRWNSL